MVWLTEERRLVLIAAGTNFRDPQHQSPARRKQDLNLRHGLVVITTAQLHSGKPELRFHAGSLSCIVISILFN